MKDQDIMEVIVQTEMELARGWEFEVDVPEGEHTHQFKVKLSWSDYDLWSRGQVSPEKVVMAVFAFLIDREPVSMIFSKFDCAVVRRYFPEVDEKIGDYVHKQ